MHDVCNNLYSTTNSYEKNSRNQEFKNNKKREKKLQIQKWFKPAVNCCRQTSVLSFIQAIAKKYRFYAVFNAKPRLMLQYVTTQMEKWKAFVHNKWDFFIFKTFFYSLMNMRQLQILFNQTKLDIGLFVDLAEFPCFLPVLAWCDHNIVLQTKTKQCYDHIMQELVKTGKFS